MPFWAHTDAQIYQRELDASFYGQHWGYVGLEVEVPNTGDYKLTHIGERQVIVVWDRVAPKTYKLNGELAGLPFKDGVKDAGTVNGGMPVGFDLSAHGLTKLRVAVLHGLVFATFVDQTEPPEDYLGSDVMPWANRIFSRPGGPKKLTLLGYNRQRIPGNWMENIKDPTTRGCCTPGL